MPDRLKTAEWLAAPGVQAVFKAIEQDGDTARAVGGAVRNTLLGRPVHDVDIATTALPQTVIERAKRAGLKAVPTGIDHGTVTIVSHGFGYEVTTLRADVETFGRQAKVRFGRNWDEDARRRDFTMNALYCDRRGEIFDPLGGLQDCLTGKVRFIGDPNQRIREDYLRILRFFRIHAMYGKGAPDQDGVAACVQERDGLRALSAERVGMEMKRLVTAPLASQCIDLMESHGLLEIVTGGVARLVDFRAFRDLRPVAEEVDAAPLALAALAGFIEEDIDRLSDRFRLSKAERSRMHRALSAMQEASRLPADPGDADIRRLLFHNGRAGAVDGVLLSWAVAGGGAEQPAFVRLLERLRTATVPVFPIKGRDLIAVGVSPGPDLGRRLKALQKRWEESGFSLGVKDLIEENLGSL